MKPSINVRLLVLLNIQMRESFESMKYDKVPNPTENKIYPKKVLTIAKVLANGEVNVLWSVVQERSLTLSIV